MSILPDNFKLEIVISPDGTVSNTVTGVSGPDCEKLQKLFADLGEELSHTKTADYYKRPDLKATILNRG